MNKIITEVIGVTLATLIAGFITRLSVDWSISTISIGVLILLCSYFAYRMYKLSRSISERFSGILKEYLSNNKPTLEKQIALCKNSFYFLGISAKRTVSAPELQEKLIEIGKKGGEIRFLLMNPKSPTLKRKADDEGDDWNAWKKDIEAQINRLKAIGKNNNIKISVKLYDEFPIWRMVIIDTSKMYLHYFLSEQQGPQSPLLEIEEKKNGIFHSFYREYLELWNRSIDA
jgi:hypothetical protein